MFRKSKDSDTVEKFELPWPRINKLIGGGLQRKRLMVLGGNAGIGKTSMAMQIAYHIATVYKLPIFCFCMEMPEVSLATKIVQLKYDITDAEVSFGDALIYAMDLKDVPIYFGYSSKITPQIYYNTLVEVRNRYGVQFGIFDNLQRLVRSDSESDMGKASGMFKDITMDLNIPFLLISQPRKLNSEDIPTFDVLKGSSAIPQDADIVILIHRKRSRVEDGSTSYESKTYAVVDKSRFSSGGMVVLNFKGEKSRFEEYT
jgi:replicative DNA helicase